MLFLLSSTAFNCHTGGFVAYELVEISVRTTFEKSVYKSCQNNHRFLISPISTISVVQFLYSFKINCVLEYPQTSTTKQLAIQRVFLKNNQETFV